LGPQSRAPPRYPTQQGRHRARRGTRGAGGRSLGPQPGLAAPKPHLRARVRAGARRRSPRQLRSPAPPSPFPAPPAPGAADAQPPHPAQYSHSTAPRPPVAPMDGLGTGRTPSQQPPDRAPAFMAAMLSTREGPSSSQLPSQHALSIEFRRWVLTLRDIDEVVQYASDDPDLGIFIEQVREEARGMSHSEIRHKWRRLQLDHLAF